MSTGKPISVAEFRAGVVAQTAQADQRRRQEAAAANRAQASRAGMTVGGTLLLLTAARLHAAFADFPTRLPLASDNGYRRGLALVFDAADGAKGVWRVEASEPCSTDGIEQMRPHDVFSAALKAMGIPHSPEAMAALEMQAAWLPVDGTARGEADAGHDRFFAALSETVQMLPYEVRRRLPGHGVRLFQPLKGPQDISGRAFAVKFADWVLGCGAGVPFIDDHGRCPLHFLALDGNQVQLSVFLDTLALKAKSPFAVDTRDCLGQTPLMLAVEHGHQGNASLLMRAGANRHMADNQGNTLAHFAARLTVSDAEDGLAMFRFLDSIEQPLDRPNKEGVRAADLVADMLSVARDDGARPEALARLEEIQSFLEDRNSCRP